jgi:hypothetical protein
MGVFSTYVKRFLGRVFFADGVEIDADLSLSGTMTSGSVPADRVNIGTLDAARSWAYTGDVTKSVGVSVLAIANSAVTYAKMQNVAAWSVIGNATGSAAAPAAVDLRALPTYIAFNGNNGILTFTANGQACLTSVTANGAVLAGRGSTYDLRLGNRSGAAAYSVPQNTVNSLLHGNCTLDQVGSGYGLRSGTNARAGTAVLVGGTVTVNNTSVTANTQILLTAQNTGGTAGALRISAKVNGTSFTITSTSATDTSTVLYLLLEVTP